MLDAHGIGRKLLPFSGGLLMGIAGFWILPEVASGTGWMLGVFSAFCGFAALWLIDHYLYAICPSCSHSHEHDGCAESLHGFAAPLVLAAAVHSFLDGWSLVASAQEGSRNLEWILLAGVALHKLPEGLALGAILRAALDSTWRVAVGSLLAEGMTLVGGVAALQLASHMGIAWLGILLAVAAGTFAFLGYHAIEGANRQRGSSPLLSALAGTAGAAALRVLLPGV